ncbi:MAG: inositol monophosphatase [Pseudomonadota bacterium]
MLDQATRAALIKAVQDAARAEVLPRFRSLTAAQVETKSSPTDLVTEADKAMEDRLRSAFETILPGVAFVGEESIAEEPGLIDALTRGEEAVILDPIDGTWNFAHGLATFGTLLAISDSQGTVFGLLYDPVVDDWVWAERGGGTHHSNGARFQTSPATSEKDLAGVIAFVAAPETDIAHVARLAPRFRAITDNRASVFDYRLMAEGLLNFSVSRGLNPWDHAAGALALTEAGGTAHLTDGVPYTPRIRTGRMVAAGNAAAWDTVRAAFDPILD